MRTIAGYLVTFGAPVPTSLGLVQFDAGSCRFPRDLSRVKLLREHEQAATVLGYAIAAETRPAGVWVTWRIADTTEAHAAADAAAAQLRDGFSVGIMFDAETLTAIYRNPTKPARAAGVVREGSLVSIPAADDCRVTDHKTQTP